MYAWQKERGDESGGGQKEDDGMRDEEEDEAETGERERKQIGFKDAAAEDKRRKENGPQTGIKIFFSSPLSFRLVRISSRG